MSAIDSGKRYQVQPLECWPKLKELRRRAAMDLWNAPKEGRPVIVGLLSFASSVGGGFDASVFTFGPNFGKILEDSRLVSEYCDLAEEKGLGPDTCSNARVQFASLYTRTHNVNPATGETIVPTFGLDIYLCPAQIKLNREFCEHYGVPSFEVEVPTFPGREEYFLAQLLETIEAIEKKMGLKCDDEKLIQCVRNEWRSKVLFAKVANLQKNVPAPLDLKLIISLISILQNAKLHSQEVVDALQELLDEAQFRVDKHIAAMGEERARIQFEGQQPWYTYRDLGAGFMWRCAAEYGGVGVGSCGNMATYGAWDSAEDGTRVPSRNLEERGVVLKSREDALRALADLYVTHCPSMRGMGDLGFHIQSIIKFAKDWHIDAVIMNMDRSCHPSSLSTLETRLGLQEAGVPCMVYEAPHCDPREINMAEIRSRLETFMETLGLQKL